MKKERRESVQLYQGQEKIFGVIHYPLEPQGTCPAVLMCHGLGGNKVGTYRLYVDLAEALSAVGIIAMRIDFRGAGDSDGAFSKMTIHSQVDDAKVALEFLKSDPQVDTGRIGLFGRSLGGLIATLTALQCPWLKSLGLWAPLFSGQPWLQQWKMAATLTAGGKMPSMQVNGVYPGMELFKQLFECNLEVDLPKLHHVPLLHICGEKDQLVTLFHAEKFQAGRQSAPTSQFTRYPGSDHGFSDTAERLAALKETVEWFQKTLA